MRALTALSALVLVACSGCAAGLTGPLRVVSEDAAIVDGVVVTSTGGQVEYWAQFGTTRAYGSETPHETASAQANSPASVNVTFANLQRSTRYHYRLCAQDAQQQGGPRCGEDRTFKTQQFGCGETVTTDMRLTGDLPCANELGLIVGADGLDIDLAGHTVIGGIFVGSSGPSGIDNTAGHDDLTVHDGGLHLWGEAISLNGASRNRIIRVQASAAGHGIAIHGGDANEIRHSGVGGRTGGLLATGSTHLVVADSSATGTFDSGIEINGDTARVVRNQLLRDGGAFPVASGIEVTGSDNRIADNGLEGWSYGGIVVGGSNNVLAGNEVFGGLVPDVPDGPAGRYGDGIFVGAFSAGTLLRANRTHDNEGDGIEVQAAATRLGDNASLDNGDFGIDAVAGVNDLGGNTASGNGNPLQCRNVFCQ